jgi:hypothetical protein
VASRVDGTRSFPAIRAGSPVAAINPTEGRSKAISADTAAGCPLPNGMTNGDERIGCRDGRSPGSLGGGVLEDLDHLGIEQVGNV